MEVLKFRVTIVIISNVGPQIIHILKKNIIL